MANSTSHLFKELDEQSIAKLIRQHTQSELIEYTLQSGGLFNTTYKIRLHDNRQMILRVGPIRPDLLMYYEKDMMAAEAFVFSAMEAAGIPCSHIIATGKVDGRDFMLVDYIESVPLSNVHLSDTEKWKKILYLKLKIFCWDTMTEPFSKRSILPSAPGRSSGSWATPDAAKAPF